MNSYKSCTDSRVSPRTGDTLESVLRTCPERGFSGSGDRSQGAALGYSLPPLQGGRRLRWRSKTRLGLWVFTDHRRGESPCQPAISLQKNLSGQPLSRRFHRLPCSISERRLTVGQRTLPRGTKIPEEMGVRIVTCRGAYSGDGVAPGGARGVGPGVHGYPDRDDRNRAIRAEKRELRPSNGKRHGTPCRHREGTSAESGSSFF